MSNQLIIGGNPFTISLEKEAQNKAGNALTRFAGYALNRGLVVLKKDAPGAKDPVYRGKLREMHKDFEVVRARYEQQIRPAGALIAADPNWKLVKFAPSKGQTSVTLRYRKTSPDSGLQALLAQSQAEIAELKAKLAARDV